MMRSRFNRVNPYYKHQCEEEKKNVKEKREANRKSASSFRAPIPKIKKLGDLKSNQKEDNDLEIKKLKSSKDKIKQPPLAESKTIPKFGTSCILNGTTGQGKSTLLANLIADPRFFGTSKNSFFMKLLISPTAEGDDVQKELGIEEGCTISDLEAAPEILKEIMRMQKQSITDEGNDKAPQVAIIYDDVISDAAFMRSNEFIKSFIASRHFNFTTFVCSQSWTAVPRKCRIQASNIFFFAAPLSEVELLFNEYCPPKFNKKQFFALVDYATSEPYSFLYINKSVPMEERFRKNLDEIIDLKSFLKSVAHLNKSGDVTESNKEEVGASTQGKIGHEFESTSSSEQITSSG